MTYRCSKCNEYYSAKKKFADHEKTGCDQKKVEWWTVRKEEIAAEDKKRREAEEERQALRKAQHEEDLANPRIVNSTSFEEHYQSAEFKAVGRKSGRDIWAQEVTVRRSRDWSEGSQWKEWETSTSATGRNLAESKLYAAVLAEAIKFIESLS